MPTEDVQLGADLQPTETEVPQTQETAQEEYIPLRFRGEEKQVPKRLIEELAQSLGSDPATGAMRIQQTWDASRVYEESKRNEQKWQRHLQDQEEAHASRIQQLEKEWQAKLSQQRPAGPDPDDPIELLKLSVSEQRALKREIAEIRQSQNEERQHFAQMIDEQRQIEDSQRIASAHEGAVKEWKEKHPKLQLPSAEEIESYLLETGLAHNRRVPWERAFRIALRDLTYDQLPQMAAGEALDKLRNPHARIVTPGSTSPPATKPKTSDLEAQLEGIKWGDVVDSIPSARR